jgi:CheY-like chemotaxis protein
MPPENRTTLTVLIVDDDAGAARALARLLRACGHTAHVAYDAQEGFELASRMKPDLILHDLAMPGIDGHEAARRLRAAPEFSNTVLIACSGSVDEEKARAAGFDGWLVKPISDGDLDAVLETVLQRVNSRAASSENGKAPRPTE